ncbi:hypothetical protein HQ587_10805 [bacterium]|nr:hypothetical protein [bacterium]
MKKLFFLIISLSIVLLHSEDVSAQTWELRGSLRSWIRGFTHSPNEIDLMESRLKLELISGMGENSAFFVRSFLSHDGRSDDEVKLDLKQAYIDYYCDWVTFRFGKQLMTWGKADEINPTDVLNPQDLANILEDKIIRKIGLFALKANWYIVGFDLETIWKPQFEAMKLPQPGSKWNFLTKQEMSEMPSPTYPSDDLDNTEWGLRLSKTISMFDFSMSFYDGLESIYTPEMIYNMQTGTMRINRLLFHRVRMLGADFAGSVKSIGIWGEGAYFITRDEDGIDPIIKNPHIQFVVGSDYTFHNGLKVNVQFLQEIITKIADDAERDKEEKITSKLGVGLPLQQALTTRIALPFGSGDAHSIELFCIYDLKDEGYLAGPRIRYSPEDAVVIEVSASIFNGKSSSMFGKFSENDAVSIKCTYSF